MGEARRRKLLGLPPRSRRRARTAAVPPRPKLRELIAERNQREATMWEHTSGCDTCKGTGCENPLLPDDCAELVKLRTAWEVAEQAVHDWRADSWFRRSGADLKLLAVQA